MKKVIVLTSLCFLSFLTSNAQKQTKNPKVVLITLDGYRWQELFTGADAKLVENEKYVEKAEGLKAEFWRETPQERRAVLMPFFWNKIAKMGQIHGNRTLGSKVNLTNTMWFSYPGYNEILTGAADDARINSNDKFNNPNKTVLEKINEIPQYHGKVAAFGSWDVFPFIVNEERSGILVNAGFEMAKEENLSEREMFLNELLPIVPSPWDSVRLDAFTANYALEYMKKTHPSLMYISYGETDDFAHEGKYDAYLRSAHAADALIEKLWDFTQSDPFYKDNTIFLISTDHGRGTEPLHDWTSHGGDTVGSDQTWLVAFGAGVKVQGEVVSKEQLYSNQIAPTILDILVGSKDLEMKGDALKLLSK